MQYWEAHVDGMHGGSDVRYGAADHGVGSRDSRF